MNGSLVQLDENYRNSRIEDKIILKEEDKQKLIEQLSRDTQFLASQNIMDYSLIAMIDRSSMKVIIGIVDYFRTYTFDKAMESFVKRTRFFAENHLLPTIISPEEYQGRFMSSMHEYFYVSPLFGT